MCTISSAPKTGVFLCWGTYAERWFVLGLMHLCLNGGKQMLQRCLNLRSRWSDIFQRDQSLAFSAHHFDLYSMKCWGDSVHFREPQVSVRADQGNGSCYSGQRFIYHCASGMTS